MTNEVEEIEEEEIQEIQEENEEVDQSSETIIDSIVDLFEGDVDETAEPDGIQNANMLYAFDYDKVNTFDELKLVFKSIGFQVGFDCSNFTEISKFLIDYIDGDEYKTRLEVDDGFIDHDDMFYYFDEERITTLDEMKLVFKALQIYISTKNIYYNGLKDILDHTRKVLMMNEDCDALDTINNYIDCDKLVTVEQYVCVIRSLGIQVGIGNPFFNEVKHLLKGYNCG
jgi:hypothetical protein